MYKPKIFLDKKYKHHFLEKIWYTDGKIVDIFLLEEPSTRTLIVCYKRYGLTYS